MISKRCTNFNLLNHIRQKNIKYTIDIVFCRDRYNENYLNWTTTFNLKGKKYQGIGKTKKKSIEKIMELS